MKNLSTALSNTTSIVYSFMNFLKPAQTRRKLIPKIEKVPRIIRSSPNE